MLLRLTICDFMITNLFFRVQLQVYEVISHVTNPYQLTFSLKTQFCNDFHTAMTLFMSVQTMTISILFPRMHFHASN
jgi:hypothetical protein